MLPRRHAIGHLPRIKTPPRGSRALWVLADHAPRPRKFEIAKTTIDLVPLAVPFFLPATNKKRVLADAVGLASNAAAIALCSGQGPVLAVELLEAGRGAIAGSLQGIRADIFSLRETHVDLAAKFEGLRYVLDVPSSDELVSFEEPSFKAETGLDVQTKADRRHATSDQMAVLLDVIREKPGFERFLKSLPEAEMRRAAELGPIVVVNVSDHRCDALLVQQSGIQAVALPKLSKGDIVK